MLKTFIFALILSAIVYSCGNDTTTNVTTPPATNDSLIFSKDSIIVYTDSLPLTKTLTVLQNDTVHFNKFRISFTGTSNDSSTLAGIVIDIYHNTDSIYSEIISGINVNQSYDK